MCLGVVLVDEMHVVSADEAYAVLFRELYQVAVYLQLHGIGLVVGALDSSLMQLQFEIVIVAEELLVPQDRFLGRLHVSRSDHARDLATQTCRTADQPFVVSLYLGAVGAGTHVETLGPRLRDDLYQIVVSLGILGQKYEVVTALVGLALLELQAAARHVNLAAYDGLEILLGQGVVLLL